MIVYINDLIKFEHSVNIIILLYKKTIDITNVTFTKLKDTI